MRNLYEMSYDEIMGLIGQYPYMCELADRAADVVNMLSLDNDTAREAFCARMANKHRTLQQAFTRLCICWLLTLANAESVGRYDERNEASVKLAARIRGELENAALPLI